MTREEKDESNARFRHRYATQPSLRSHFRRYAANRRNSFKGRMAYKIYHMTLGHRGRYKPLYEPLMTHITGLTREQFTARFFHGEQTDHIVPLSRFDLSNPDHLVRAMHPSNLRCILKTNNLVKSNQCPDNILIMSLPWTVTPQALSSARKLIQLVQHPKMGRPPKNNP